MIKSWIKSIGIAIAYVIVFAGFVLSLVWVSNTFPLEQVAAGLAVILFGVVVVVIRYTLFGQE